MPIPKYYVRPDGLHESIITVNGKRKAFRGKTDREVWNKIKAYRAEAEKPKTVPFSDVAHAWWNEIEPTLAPNSLRNYSPAYERAVAQFGPEDVATITSKEIETYINQFAKTHAKKTVITQRQIIRQILNKAQREGTSLLTLRRQFFSRRTFHRSAATRRPLIRSRRSRTT